MKTYYVYVLKCADGSHYSSITGNLDKRLEEHQSGKRKDTRNRLPVELGFQMKFTRISEAIGFELELKRWSSRQKETLISKKRIRSRLFRKDRQQTAQLAFQL